MADVAPIVAGIISQSQNYASTSYSQAETLIQQANESAAGFSSIANPPALTTASFHAPGAMVDTPGAFSASFQLGKLPALDQLKDLYVPVFDQLSETPGTKLDYNSLFKFDAPGPLTAAPPADAPDVGGPISSPAAPALTTYQAPTPSDITMPVKPTFVMPVFTASRPDFSGIQAPTGLPERFAATYDSATQAMRAWVDSSVEAYYNRYFPSHKTQLAALEARVTLMLAGGTALPPEVEQAIYDRARSRTEAEQGRAAFESQRWGKRRGFTFPPLRDAAAAQRAAQAAADANGRAAMDVAIRQAEMEQANIQFAMSLSKDLRLAVRDAALQYATALLQINSQALDYSKATIQAILDSFNALLRLAELEEKLYLDEGTIFEIRLKAALADLSRYEAEAKVASLQVDIDKNLIERFAEQEKAEFVKVQLFAEQMRAVQIEIDRRRLLVQLFEERIHAFAAQVQGKEAEVRVYEAAMRGDEAKVRGFAEIWQGWKAEADAKRAKGELEVARMDGGLKQNQNVLERFRAELAPYMAVTDLQKLVIDTEIKAYINNLERYKADLSRQEAEMRTQTDYDRLVAENARVFAQMAVQVGTTNANLFTDALRVRAQTATAAAGIYGSIAAAAISSVNSMAHLSSQTVSNS
jgi:hypothetical protein